MSFDSRIIVSLDFSDAASAVGLVNQLGASANFYKVGLQLLTAVGPSVVRELVDARKSVFLDLKLLEIPSSVANAVIAAGHLGASMVTVHASGGTAVLRSAVQAASQFPKLKILALTVITSMCDRDLEEVGVASTVPEQVVRLGRLAIAAGCHGVVSSPLEARLLREVLPPSALIVTPGTQLFGDKQSDHARAATPTEAIEAGATHVVIGRPISRASNPAAVFAAVRAQLPAANRLS